MKLLRKKKKAGPEIEDGQEFFYAMEYVKRYLENEDEPENKIVFLDFVLEVIKNDLKYDLLAHIFYNKEHFKDKFKYPLPLSFWDEEGKEKPISELGVTKIDLGKDFVLVQPWNRKRLYNKIISMNKNKFVYDKLNHFGYHYPYLNLTTIYNGTHSISSGIIYKKGTIEVNAVDITETFPHIYTDGRYWYNVHNKEKKGNVTDFRLAIIYEVAKMKYGLEKLTY